jgi:enediyne biosynthesis protein E4
MAVPRVLRGSAHGDIDNDGDPDVLVVWNNRRGELWRNDGGNASHWIGLRLQGTRSNRDGIGALVRVTAGRQTQSAYRRSGGSFLAENDPRLRFGLGKSRRADEIMIRWPSGAVSHYRNVAAGHYYAAREGEDRLEQLPKRAWPVPE